VQNIGLISDNDPDAVQQVRALVNARTRMGLAAGR
jgi:hypothetical protein